MHDSTSIFVTLALTLIFVPISKVSEKCNRSILLCILFTNFNTNNPCVFTVNTFICHVQQGLGSTGIFVTRALNLIFAPISKVSGKCSTSILLCKLFTNFNTNSPCVFTVNTVYLLFICHVLQGPGSSSNFQHKHILTLVMCTNSLTFCI